ncbi:hypothetical protein Skr01_37280 [Sphaerisporangium krabiense]|uniref:ABC-2 type transport system permease protein n=1 Tax=Sphaerisporangium krabiense TaxID=763782 RepID=A0A7W9DQ72_9ACTN|nr:ABC transporter [Sphaerisporangium krabiense]MBB5626724.1 ABC-2 type transport system permease protein [Sphaerisporangium krabiense]GII63643.1 hypothetical protein Skr01_37280 [Sphaerisporangium krabiense]
MTGGPPAIRLADLLRAELTKIRTLPAAWIALAVALLGGTLLGLLSATDAVRVAGRQGTVAIAQLGTVMLAPAYVVLAVPVFAAGGEYRGGQLRVTLAATPDRGRLFAAKLLATCAATALAATVVVLSGRLVRLAAGGGLPGADGGPGRAVAEVTAYVLLGLVGHGLAVAAKGVVVPLAVLAALPVLVSPPLGGSLPAVVRLLPHEVTLSFLATSATPALTVPRPAALPLLVSWAALSLTVARLLTARRDA